MKKVVFLILVLCLLVAQTSCGQAPADEQADPSGAPNFHQSYSSEGEKSETDSVRLAISGVTVTAGGYLFSDNYFWVDSGKIKIASCTEHSSSVGPGTKTGGSPLTVKVEGTPEVDVRFTLSIADDSADVYLKAGTYPDMTTASSTDTFTLEFDYFPIQYTLKEGSDVLKVGSLSEIKAFLDANPIQVEANTAVNSTYTLTFEWPFDSNGENEQADTLLGDLLAGANLPIPIDGNAYNTQVDVKLTLTAAPTE